MPIRWPACTRGWTCRSITDDDVSVANSRARTESTGLFAMPRPRECFALEGLARRAGRESRGCHHTLHRQVDSHLPVDHSGRDSSAQARQLTLAGALSPHVGLVCVLLWLA